MEDFVTIELAVKLKEKGFPQRPDYFNYNSYYEWDGLRKIHSLSNASVWFDPNLSRDNIYFAPTISQVLKWLREEKRIHIVITVCSVGWLYDVYHIETCKSLLGDYEDDTKQSYELAALAGIEYCLDNFI